MKILVGMSGGAGSFCAAKMLMEQGNEVTCATVKTEGADITAAEQGASAAGAPLVTLHACGSDHAAIVTALYDYAREGGFDAVATGHICGRSTDGYAHIVRAASERDDESYLLCLLTREQILMLTLPLAEMTSEQIAEYAASHGYESSYVKTPVNDKEKIAAKAIVIKDVSLQKFENPPYERGFSSYLCGSSAKSGKDAACIKSHVYGHIRDGKLIADIIFFEDSATVQIGEKVAVYNDDGDVMLGGICEYVHS